jgi:hypothetical protein
MKKSSEELSDLQDRMAARREMVRTGEVRAVPPASLDTVKETLPTVQKSASG